jgi:hypothetical protein
MWELTIIPTPSFYIRPSLGREKWSHPITHAQKFICQSSSRPLLYKHTHLHIIQFTLRRSVLLRLDVSELKNKVIIKTFLERMERITPIARTESASASRQIKECQSTTLPYIERNIVWLPRINDEMSIRHLSFSRKILSKQRSEENRIGTFLTRPVIIIVLIFMEGWQCLLIESPLRLRPNKRGPDKAINAIIFTSCSVFYCSLNTAPRI